jgi:hypothetical protein
MTSLVQHLHAFAREVKLSEAEWTEGMRFLGECGRLCSERRQEFVLLSDTLGLSMLVTALNQRKPKGCTESTVCGPFYVEAAPHFEPGAGIGQGASGEPCFVRGSVRALDGSRSPAPNCSSGSPMPTTAATCSVPNAPSPARAASWHALRTAASTSSPSWPGPMRSRTTGLWGACCATWDVTPGARRTFTS